MWTRKHCDAWQGGREGERGGKDRQDDPSTVHQDVSGIPLQKQGPAAEAEGRKGWRKEEAANREPL